MTLASSPYFIDANIWVYAVGRDHPLKAPCAEILRALAAQTFSSETSVEVLQEILHLYTRRNQRSLAVEFTRNFSSLMSRILPVVEADVERALVLHSDHPTLTARDAIHAAVMYNHGLTHIISADKHFDALPGIVRIDPTDWFRHRSTPA